MKTYIGFLLTIPPTIHPTSAGAVTKGYEIFSSNDKKI